MFSGPDFIAYLSDRAQNNRQFQVIILVYIRLRLMCKPIRAFAAHINGTQIAI